MKIYKTFQSLEDNSKRYVWQFEGIPQGIESGVFKGIGKQNRYSLTVSVQNGCSWHTNNKQCNYCVTGKQDFWGNLKSEEIVSQITGMLDDNYNDIVNSELEIAYMGMGEPANNYQEVKKAIIESEKIIKEKYKIKVFRHIFATCGVPLIIYRLKEDILSGDYGDAVIKLHLSLHSANSTKRKILMPVDELFPIDEVIKASKDFGKSLKAMVNINYMLFKNYELDPGITVNTIAHEDINELLDKLDPQIHKIIFCEFNETFGRNGIVTEEEATQLKQIATQKGFQANIFGAFGKSIKLACGQLSGKLI